MPYFFGWLKVATTLAFVGSVVPEPSPRTVASNHGLGQMMSQVQCQFNGPLVFAGLIIRTVEGIGMYAVMAWI